MHLIDAGHLMSEGCHDVAASGHYCACARNNVVTAPGLCCSAVQLVEHVVDVVDFAGTQ